MEWRAGADGVEWLEAELADGARAAFSTRLGGVSEGSFEALNLGLLTGDRRAAVVENRRRLTAALGRPAEGILFGHQVHGAEISVRSEPQETAFGDPADLPQADGQVARGPGLTPLVLVADCLPIALAGPRGIAMLHCGWRGMAAGIVASGVEATDAAAAAIGPGIGRCCYEVGTEVLDAFLPLGDGIADGRMLDLVEAARRLLAEAGVERVEAAGICTSCERDRFFSHRRDGAGSGRQAGLAWAGEDG